MHNIFKLPRCPYCNKKISYIGSSFLKTKGEYNCGSCKCISNVVISRAAYAMASFVCVLALLIVVIYSFAGDHGSIMGILYVVAPFLIFYIIVPLLVRLVPCKDKSAVRKLKDKTIPDMPGENAYQQAAAQNSSAAVDLSVEEDFSARFMKAKSNSKSKHEYAEENEPSQIENSEPEDIGNTKIAFDISSENNES